MVHTSHTQGLTAHSPLSQHSVREDVIEERHQNLESQHATKRQRLERTSSANPLRQPPLINNQRSALPNLVLHHAQHASNTLYAKEGLQGSEYTKLSGPQRKRHEASGLIDTFETYLDKRFAEAKLQGLDQITFNIADVGCGSGQATSELYLDKLNQKAESFGVSVKVKVTFADVSHNMITEASHHAHLVGSELIDAEHTDRYGQPGDVYPALHLSHQGVLVDFHEPDSVKAIQTSCPEGYDLILCATALHWGPTKAQGRNNPKGEYADCEPIYKTFVDQLRVPQIDKNQVKQSGGLLLIIQAASDLSTSHLKSFEQQLSSQDPIKDCIESASRTKLVVKLRQELLQVSNTEVKSKGKQLLLIQLQEAIKQLEEYRVPLAKLDVHNPRAIANVESFLGSLGLESTRQPVQSQHNDRQGMLNCYIEYDHQQGDSEAECLEKWGKFPQGWASVFQIVADKYSKIYDILTSEEHAFPSSWVPVSDKAEYVQSKKDELSQLIAEEIQRINISECQKMDDGKYQLSIGFAQVSIMAEKAS